jgi:hypothetical protein
VADAAPFAPGPAATAPGRRRWVGPVLILGLFALLWFASIGTVLFAPSGERRLAAYVADPSVEVADLVSMAADPHPVGRVLYDPAQRVIVVLAKDLSPSASGRSLVAWSTRRDGSGEVNLGAFTVGSGAVPDLVAGDAPARAELGSVLVSEESDVHAKTPSRDAVRAVAKFR